MKNLLSFLTLAFSLIACSANKNEEVPEPENIRLTNATSVTDARGNVYTVGFDQATSVNQNPFVRKVNA